MSIKTLLVPLDSTQDGGAAMGAALMVARRFAAHIEALFVRTDPEAALPYATILSQEMRRNIVEVATRSADQAADAARKAFETACRQRKVAVRDTPSGKTASAAWRDNVGHEANVVATRGRLADLIVLPQPARPSPAPAPLEAALLETGRGVLIVPPPLGKQIGNHVVIAWNGAKEAAAAVAAGLPFLAGAKAVTVLSANEKKKSRDLPAEELVAYLGWHEIKANIRAFDPRSRDIGKALLAEAKTAGADLLVMGGYGHSRERELILGGATREIIAGTHIPVLMAH